LSAYSELDECAAQEHRAWLGRAAANIVHDRAGGESAARRMVGEISRELLTITRLLSDEYGTPDLGNKSDPVDELVYIILSRRTREGAYQDAYAALRSKYASWEEVAGARLEEIARVIAFSGLGGRKARSIKLALEMLIERFGRCTLEPTRIWTDDETRDFLCTMPEVGPKSAACVMMCALDRPAFPVDAHVGRVLERVAVFRLIGIDLTGADHKVKQCLLSDAVPPALRYTLHVNMLLHGRSTCLVRRPRCGDCVIRTHCVHGRSRGVTV
jgi:endonuclease III